jgi:uncharacterized protein (UPF0210 family)
MTVTLKIPRALESRLEEQAGKEGITVPDLVQRTLQEKFPLLSDEDQQAISIVEQWISAAPTSPGAKQEAEDDLKTFQQSLNQTRKEAGARLVYPEKSAL